MCKTKCCRNCYYQSHFSKRYFYFNEPGRFPASARALNAAGIPSESCSGSSQLRTLIYLTDLQKIHFETPD